MVKVTRISKTPATALDVQINREIAGPPDAEGKATKLQDRLGLSATPATDEGPTFIATLEDADAAKLQEDAGLAKHFTFEPVVEKKATTKGAGAAAGEAK